MYYATYIIGTFCIMVLHGSLIPHKLVNDKFPIIRGEVYSYEMRRVSCYEKLTRCRCFTQPKNIVFVATIAIKA
jgi:hypothetical protein